VALLLIVRLTFEPDSGNRAGSPVTSKLTGAREGNAAMVTDSTQHDSRQQFMTTASQGVLARVGGQLRQFVCGLHGHDEFLHFEQGRISLQCVSCGYQSPGWEVKQAGARPEAQAVSAVTAAPAPRARILRLPSLSHRRVA
jgi:hypothetical protein